MFTFFSFNLFLLYLPLFFFLFSQNHAHTFTQNRSEGRRKQRLHSQEGIKKKKKECIYQFKGSDHVRMLKKYRQTRENIRQLFFSFLYTETER